MQIIKDITLDEAQERIAEIEETNFDAWSIETACGEGTKIFLDKSFIRIPKLLLDIYAGDFCNYNEEEDCWDADYSLYAFFMVGDTSQPVYDEGGSSLEVCIHNYYPHLKMEDIAQLDCELHIQEVPKHGESGV